MENTILAPRNIWYNKNAKGIAGAFILPTKGRRLR
jgi:hypothetical protein